MTPTAIRIVLSLLTFVVGVKAHGPVQIDALLPLEACLPALYDPFEPGDCDGCNASIVQPTNTANISWVGVGKENGACTCVPDPGIPSQQICVQDTDAEPNSGSCFVQGGVFFTLTENQVGLYSSGPFVSVTYQGPGTFPHFIGEQISCGVSNWEIVAEIRNGSAQGDIVESGKIVASCTSCAGDCPGI